jgi:hypothetical protein
MTTVSNSSVLLVFDAASCRVSIAVSCVAMTVPPVGSVSNDLHGDGTTEGGRAASRGSTNLPRSAHGHF